MMQVSKIWVPYMILSNSIGKFEKLAKDWHLVYVLYDGTVYYNPGSTFSASCRVDVSYYPWDRQVCPFYFYVFGYTFNHVRINLISNKVLQTYYYDNGEWSLQDSNAFVNHSIDGVIYELYLERKPRFVVVNIIIPIIFICFLDMLVFLIPSESGERISYCITMLLALAVFLTLVSDNLPKTSNPMSIFSYYLMSVIVISMCITMGTIFNLNIYHKNEKEAIGGFYLYFTRMVNRKLCQKRSKMNGSRRKSNKEKMLPGHYSVDATSGHKMYKDGSLSCMNDKSPMTTRKDTTKSLRTYHEKGYSLSYDRVHTRNDLDFDNDDVTWNNVSSAFDKLWFVFSAVATVVNTAVFMYVMSTGESDLDLY